MMDVDTAISQVERLYRSVTGRDAPLMGDTPYAPIPPEQDPERYVNEQLDRLIALLEKRMPAAVGAPTGWVPEVAVWDGEQEHLITVDVPGVPRGSVNVALEGNTLVVSGERRQPRTDACPLRTRFMERPTGVFKRAVVLPPGANADQIRARMTDGVLEIHVPRLEQASRSTTIPVQ
jgi:HSP20 family protein